MSEQPVPCKLIDNCNHEQTAETCNDSCEYYNPEDDSISPEMESLVKEEIKKSKNEKDINLKHSAMEKFDKNHEFVVLKKHVFELQSISPKKIILKYKRKLNKTDNINDGIYVFTDRNDELLIPHKVFAKFDKDAKAKNNK
ncbi:MAG: hypothetical protein ACTSWD_11680 [Candidatus Heimdallarchaeota archaeon]